MKKLLLPALLLIGVERISAQDVTVGLVSKYTFDNQDVTDEVSSFDGIAMDVFYASPGYGGTGSSIFFDGYDPNGQFPTRSISEPCSEIPLQDYRKHDW